MKWNRLGGWMVLGFSIPAAFADVVDDLGIPEQEFFRALNFSSRPMGPESAGTKQVFLGLPLSDAHQAAIEGEFDNEYDGNLPAFLESRGNFVRALHNNRLTALDKTRLLLRTGQADEARAFLTDEMVRKIKSSMNPSYQLPSVFRPLEDSAAWDDLHALLALLGEKFHSPQWRVAIWTEELDVAWHLDQLPALLERNANDPLRLAFFHHRLGNVAERDSLITGLLENATPERVTELFGMMRSCPQVIDAALALWDREDMTSSDRLALFDTLSSLPPTANFDAIFRAWLEKNGDARPLADSIWQRWAPTSNSDPQRTAVLTALVQRHPDELRFHFLLGRQLITTDAARATELFTTMAAQPFQTLPKLQWRSGWSENLNSIPTELQKDLPGLGILGLGILNRQDLISAAIEKQPGWAGLPPVDQARYLAFGKMDFALVKLVLEADFSKPENDGLASVLKVVLDTRLKNRTLPQEIVQQLASKFDSIVAGSSAKDSSTVASDARELLTPLAKVDATAWKEPLERLIATSEKRDAEKTENLKQQVQGVAARHPEMKEILPERQAPPRERGRTFDISKGMEAQRLLTLFAPPEIRRISPPEESNRRPWRDPHPSGFGGAPSELPLEYLTRWAANAGLERGPMNVPGSKAFGDMNGTAVESLMRYLGTGNPRRLIAEILIATDMIPCGDEALKMEAQASFKAFMDGSSKESRGNEVFRYLTLAAESPEKEEELREILRGLKAFPPTVKKNIISQLMGLRIQDNQATRIIREEFRGSMESPQRQPQPDPGPSEDDRKLVELINKQLTAAPETIGLAKRMLDKAALIGSNDPLPGIIHSAAQVLNATGSMDAWAKETPEKLRAAGVSELEILLRLQRIDLRRNDESGENGDQSQRYAREILKLDPTSAPAAQRLIATAAREGNRDLLLTCLRALGSDGLQQLAGEHVLGIFSKEDAPEIFAIFQELNLNDRTPGYDTVGNLHRYFLKSDPALAAKFRQSLEAGSKGDGTGRVLMMGQLLDAGRKDEAVEMEARAFVVPPEYPGFPFQFPPKPGTGTERPNYQSLLGDLKQDLDLLSRWKLSDEVIARMEALGGADPVILATFRLSITPDVATFERHALPLFYKLSGIDQIQDLLYGWEELVEKQPGASALRLRLILERAAITDEMLSDIDKNVNLIQSVAIHPGSASLIAARWENITKTLAATSDAEEKAENSRLVCRIIREMLVSADDATWNSYWKWRENEPEELGQLSYLPILGAPTHFIDPARLRQISPKVLKDFDGQIPVEQAESWVLAAVSSGDRSMLEQVRTLIPPEAENATILCDLGLGNTMAASPILGTAADENGESLLWWEFVDLAPLDKESGGSDIPRAAFTALDGKLNLQITAGKSPDQQVIVKTVSAAPSSGHLRLKLAPEQRYIAMVATDPATGVIRWSKPLDTLRDKARTIALSAGEMEGKGFEKLAMNGPGDLPAWKIRFSAKERIDLIDRPWNGDESVGIATWASGDGRLELRCFDADGNELDADEQPDLAAWDSPLPIWQSRALNVPEKQKIPAETVRLVLSVSSYGNNDGPHDFAISNTRMEIGQPTPLRKGFERIIRVPGAASSLVISPDGGHLAIAFAKGKMVTLDLATKQVTEIVKPGVSPIHDSQPSTLTWTKAGLRVLRSDGVLYRLDDSGKTLEPVINLRGKSEYFNVTNCRISPDAKWVVSPDLSSRLTLIATDGSGSREIANLRVSRFEITDEGLHISANGQAFFLKASDFAAGEPVATDESGSPRPKPSVRGKDRIIYRYQSGDDYENGDEYPISIPATPQTTAYAADDILYYIDGAGNIVRGVLSPR